MDNKQILIAATGSLGALGFLSLSTGNDIVCGAYVILSSTLLLLVCIGGFMEYTSTQMRDFREVYREKHAMSLEKIRELEKVIANLKK